METLKDLITVLTVIFKNKSIMQNIALVFLIY